jgi:hypothetical protein
MEPAPRCSARNPVNGTYSSKKHSWGMGDGSARWRGAPGGTAGQEIPPHRLHTLACRSLASACRCWLYASSRRWKSLGLLWPGTTGTTSFAALGPFAAAAQPGDRTRGQQVSLDAGILIRFALHDTVHMFASRLAVEIKLVLFHPALGCCCAAAGSLFAPPLASALLQHVSTAAIVGGRYLVGEQREERQALQLVAPLLR